MTDIPVGAASSGGQRWRPVPVGAVASAAFFYSVIVVTLLPIVWLVASSFNVAGAADAPAFGLDAWTEVFVNPSIGRSIVVSFVLSLRVAFAFCVALCISWALVRYPVPGRRFIEMSLWFAFFVPAIPMAMAWTLLLDSNYGLINQALAKVAWRDRHAEASPLHAAVNARATSWASSFASSIVKLSAARATVGSRP